jgi:hypothetical protein
MAKIITLRPHHLLCVTFFQGKGYSKEFVENMSNIIGSLDDNAEIILTLSTDDICKHCPNNIDNICKDENKSNLYDKKVLSYLALTNYALESKPIPYTTLKDIVYKQILSKGKREDVCGDCQWTSICKL